MTKKEILKEIEEMKAATKSSDLESAKPGRKKIGKRISLILPDELIDELKEMAMETGVGAYQTMIRMILVEKAKQHRSDKEFESSDSERREIARRKKGVA